MSGIESLIPLVNKLQDLFGKFNDVGDTIDLPQIAVVGEQSAGKSSVLENCVGKDFLPRGSGIVTRRPLVLQLFNNPNEEYAEFLHCKDRKFYDFEMVRKEIEAETDRITGSSKNISPIPINLRIYSPHGINLLLIQTMIVINLTLIDLPGITKLPVGDQPADIEIQIKKMLLTYITQPSCLILAVTPATIDLANSEALKIAKEVDPNGDRTIGVITKIDLMDQGTNCKEILLNNVYRLKRGYIGVVNRSQKDIDGKKNIKAAQESERNYFQTHEFYKDIVDQLGTVYLQRQLNKQLTQHIKSSLPELKSKLIRKVSGIETYVNSIKNLNTNDAAMLQHLITSSIQSYGAAMDKQLGMTNEDLDLSELSFGSIISKIMNDQFNQEIESRLKSDNAVENNIILAINNTTGVINRIFCPQQAFTTVLKYQLGAVRYVFISFLGEIYNKVLECSSCASKHLTGFPSFIDLLNDLVKKFLAENKEETLKYINMYMDVDLSFININHPDFILSSKYEGNKNESFDNLSISEEKAAPRIEKGWLAIPSFGIIKKSRDVFVVLKNSELFVYKDDNELDLRFSAPFKGMKIIDNPKIKGCFTLLYEDGRKICNDFKVLDLVTDESNLVHWKRLFESYGVTKELVTLKVEIDIPKDKVFIERFKQVKDLYESYIAIAIKQFNDQFPKMCIHFIFNKFRYWINTQLLISILSQDLHSIMRISDEELKKQKDTIELYESLTNGIKMIDRVLNEFEERVSVSSHISSNNNESYIQGKLSISSNSRNVSVENLSVQDQITPAISNPDIPKPSLRKPPVPFNRKF